MTTAHIISEGIYFGEAPRWRLDAAVPEGGRFWFSDFFSWSINSVGLAGDVRVEHYHTGRTSGLGWLPDGRLLFVSMEDRRIMRRELDGEVVVHADLSDIATFHVNDMVVDEHGRAYAGNFGYDLDAVTARDGFAALFSEPGPPKAALACVDIDGTVRVAAEGLRFPNGMIITADGNTLIVAETFGRCLTAFDRAADGTLSGSRVWAPLTRDEGGVILPDGCCLDAEGAVWVANPGAAEVLRVREGGEIVEQILTSRPSFACMLGGPDRKDLLICTAPSGDAAIASKTPQGRLELARVEVAGAGLP